MSSCQRHAATRRTDKLGSICNIIICTVFAGGQSRYPWVAQVRWAIALKPRRP
ncbi:hypothetical protein M404DRAFT_997696 [Pisolithus tinctorius Marx 270]|uniref:Uncharacterized protein n=1 Tax=Pisolithus tinctorius Marx 270 TaxID=870435 RepID=A0A0C3PHM6_PISTI|nr:hypothetical protein M404DRAFT_997696 [Pisolithus tinctorius Marx 270]